VKNVERIGFGWFGLALRAASRAGSKSVATRSARRAGRFLVETTSENHSGVLPSLQLFEKRKFSFVDRAAHR
jgi:hypothetical protein